MRSLKSIFRLAENKPAFIFIFLTLTLCLVNYSIFHEYAFSDEYGFIWQGAHGKHHNIWINGFIMQGRYLIALTNDILYPEFINNVPDLKHLRILSIITYSFYGTILYWFITQRLKLSSFTSISIVLLCLSIPGITIHIGWGTVYSYSFADTFALISGILMLDVYLFNRRYKAIKIIISIILLIATLNIYQSSFTMVLLPWFITFIFTNKNTLKLCLGIICSLFVSIIIYILIWQYSLSYFDLKPAERSGIDLTALPQKLVSFYPFIMKDIYPTVFLLLRSKFVLAISFIFFITAFILKCKDILKSKNKWLNLFFIIAIFPGSFLINLVLKDSFLCSRTMHVCAMMTIILQSSLFFRFVKKKNTYFISLLILPVLYTAAYNQNEAFAGLQTNEYKLMQNFYGSYFKHNKAIPDQLNLIIPQRNKMKNLGCIKHPYSDEFGLLSSSVEWAAPNIYRMAALNFLGPDEKLKIQRLKIKAYRSTKILSDPNVINIDSLVTSEFICE